MATCRNQNRIFSVFVDKTPEELLLEPTQTSFNDLPISSQNMAQLSRAYKGLSSLFQPMLNARKALLVEKILKQIVQFANKDEVVKLAKRYPSLFFIKATTFDCAMDLKGKRRTLEDWSAYQAIFGTGDSEMLRAVKPHLDAYLATLPNGEQLAAEQELEKFPNGFDYPPSTCQLDAMVAAITKDKQLIETGKPTPETLAVVEEFRKDNEPSVVKVGHHFNINDFIKAHQVYDDNWKSWRTSNQIKFFSIYVIGFFERLMTAFHLLAACEGLNTNHDKKSSLKRDFEVMNHVIHRTMPILPHDAVPSCRLGELFVLDSYDGQALAKHALGAMSPGMREGAS